MDVDALISELPQHIADIIFSKLPIKDVVRSSILSKTWTNKWTLVTNISIDDFVVRGPYEQTGGDEIINYVDKFLSEHNGQIDKLDIYTEFLYVTHEVEHRWLLTASQKDVKELTVEFNKQFFIAPPCIYFCKRLTRLELTYAELMEPPQRFSGFSFMKHLILTDVSVPNNGMERLISSCPILESLTLVYWGRLEEYMGRPELTIRASKLKCLDVQGVFGHISLENTPLLSYMTIALQLKSGFDSNYIEKLLGSAPKLRRLCAYINLTHSKIPGGGAPFKFITYKLLKHIELHGISFHDPNEVFAAFRLMFSAPNLQELYIKGHGRSYWDETENPCLDYFNDLILADRMMNQLELVEIRGDGPIFMKVVEFLLERSPSLVKMRIGPSGFFLDEEMKRLISSFRRASQRASIVIFFDRCLSSDAIEYVL